MEYEQLKLENQLCFPFYAISRLIIRAYQQDLDALGITYPQYLVMLVLWEENNLTVNEIARKLILNTNTITPLLKRMELTGLIRRRLSQNDRRKVIVSLTEKGSRMRQKAAGIPSRLVEKLNHKPDQIDLKTYQQIKLALDKLINNLKNIT